MLDSIELKIITDILDVFEESIKRDTGVGNISGGFASTEMFDYDDKFIDIEVKWGIQSDCSDNLHVEQYKLCRQIVNDNSVSVIDKALLIC